jgi:hypothetical protein
VSARGYEDMAVVVWKAVTDREGVRVDAKDKVLGVAPFRFPDAENAPAPAAAGISPAEIFHPPGREHPIHQAVRR